MNSVRRSASGARQGGDDYQHLVAWGRALRVYVPGREMTTLGLEVDGAGNVDDVVVSYAQPPHEFNQVKYSVNAATALDIDYLLAHTERGTSILQKFHRSWQLLGHTPEPVMNLVTNRSIHPDDPVLSAIDARTGSLEPAFARATTGSPLGKARAAWAEHLDVDEGELLAFHRCLRFQAGHAYGGEVRHVQQLMAMAGLASDDTALRTGIDIIRQWVIDGYRELNRNAIIEAIERRSLRRDEPSPVLLVQAIAWDPNPGEATEVLDWVELFEGDAPPLRRRTLSPDAYGQVMWPELSAAAERLKASGAGRIGVRGAMRLATWFAVGAALPRAAGIELSCQQNAQIWTTNEPGVNLPDLSIDTIASFDYGPDVALAIAVAADPSSDVIRYIDTTRLPVCELRRIALPAGVNDMAISDGAHAAAVAQAVRKVARDAVTDTAAPRVHLFQAGPGGLALFLGHRWNRVAPTIAYEDLGPKGYQPAYNLPA